MAHLALHEQGWDAANAACDMFWSPSARRPAEEEQSARRKRRPGRATGGIAEVASAEHEVTAATDLWLGGHREAAEAAKAAADQLLAAGETEHAAFWRYVEAHAHYDCGRPGDLRRARAALSESLKTGPRTAWFRRLTRTADELAGGITATPAGVDELFFAWDEWIRESGARLEKQLGEVRALLTGGHNEQSVGLVGLAKLAGAYGERPPRKEQSATDCRWSWVTPRRGERRVWEVKTGKSERIPRSDVNQLLGQIEVERKRAGKARVLGCLVSPVAAVEDDAAEAARDKVALIHRDAPSGCSICWQIACVNTWRFGRTGGLKPEVLPATV